MSSLASLAACVAAPIAAVFLADGKIVWLALAIAAMVIARHHENIRRLLAGTEPRIGQRGPGHRPQDRPEPRGRLLANFPATHSCQHQFTKFRFNAWLHRCRKPSEPVCQRMAFLLFPWFDAFLADVFCATPYRFFV